MGMVEYSIAERNSLSTAAPACLPRVKHHGFKVATPHDVARGVWTQTLRCGTTAYDATRSSTMHTRYVVLDTETTGLSPRYHRLAEVGCVEIACGRITGNYFHAYINPRQRMTRGAQAVHGLRDEFLATQPTFRAIAQRLLFFLCRSTLVGHNLSFDLNFLDVGLASAGFMPAARYCHGVIDTMLHLAQRGRRRRFSLDACCDMLGVRRGDRARHGALEDAVLLAEAFVVAKRTLPPIGYHCATMGLHCLGLHPGLAEVQPGADD